MQQLSLDSALHEHYRDSYRNNFVKELQCRAKNYGFLELERLRQQEMPESWKPVCGFENYYEVSSHGQVRSLAD